MSLSVCVDSVGSLLDGFDRSMRNPYDTDVFREMLEDRRQVLRDCQSVVKEMRAAGGAAEGLGFRAVPSVKDLCSRGLSFHGALPYNARRDGYDSAVLADMVGVGVNYGLYGTDEGFTDTTLRPLEGDDGLKLREFSAHDTAVGVRTNRFDEVSAMADAEARFIERLTSDEEKARLSGKAPVGHVTFGDGTRSEFHDPRYMLYYAGVSAGRSRIRELLQADGIPVTGFEAPSVHPAAEFVDDVQRIERVLGMSRDELVRDNVRLLEPRTFCPAEVFDPELWREREFREDLAMRPEAVRKDRGMSLSGAVAGEDIEAMAEPVLRTRRDTRDLDAAVAAIEANSTSIDEGLSL